MGYEQLCDDIQQSVSDGVLEFLLGNGLEFYVWYKAHRRGM